MSRNTLDRRLDLLKLEGDGLLKPEIVKELTSKYECSRQTVYNDFTNKPRWQPKIQELIHAYLRIINRHDQLYRKASLGYIQSADVKGKLFAVNIMRIINKDFHEFIMDTGYKPKQVKPDKQPVIKWQDPPELEKKLYLSGTHHIQDKQSSTSATSDSEHLPVAEDGAKPKLVRTKPSAKQ